MLRPSSLPALRECGRFVSKPSEFTDAGTARHEAFAAALQGDTFPLDLLDEEDAEGVRWAVDYVKLHAPLNDYPLEVERKLEGVLPNGDMMRGTADVVCGPFWLGDLKWRRRNYLEQYAAYALLRLRSLGFPINSQKPVLFHALYAASKSADVIEFTAASAWTMVEKVLTAVPASKETPCDYCDWCAIQVTCPALTARAEAVRNGREDWALEQYHATQIDDPAEMSKAWQLADHLQGWCKAVKVKAEEMWFKKGITIPGLEAYEKNGKRVCTNILGVYKSLGLSPEDFLKACDLRLNTSKKYPDRMGIVPIFKAQNGIPSKAAAMRAVMAKSADFFKQSKNQPKLKLSKSTKEETETEENE